MALCPAPTVLVGYLIYSRRRARPELSRRVLAQSRRRPPGESLRRRLQELEHQSGEWLAYLAICPAALGLAAGLIRAPGLVLPAVWLGASILWTGVCARRLWSLKHEQLKLEAAFDARRCLAEELNRMTAEGFEVYHDLSIGELTLDHVLVGPLGVLAVQAMTLPCPAERLGSGQDKVQFDGFRLRQSSGSGNWGLERVVANARTLGEWLNNAVGEVVEVIPILTLPGWTIERSRSDSSVLALNPQEILQLCDAKTIRLKEDLIRRICYQFNQQCGLASKGSGRLTDIG